MKSIQVLWMFATIHDLDAASNLYVLTKCKVIALERPDVIQTGIDDSYYVFIHLHGSLINKIVNL